LERSASAVDGGRPIVGGGSEYRQPAVSLVWTRVVWPGSTAASDALFASDLASHAETRRVSGSPTASAPPQPLAAGIGQVGLSANRLLPVAAVPKWQDYLTFGHLFVLPCAPNGLPASHG